MISGLMKFLKSCERVYTNAPPETVAVCVEFIEKIENRIELEDISDAYYLDLVPLAYRQDRRH
jgi:hypothetical protein